MVGGDGLVTKEGSFIYEKNDKKKGSTGVSPVPPKKGISHTIFKRRIYIARRSARSVKIDTNVRCNRVYPIEETNKDVKKLKTVGLKLSRDQTIHLARVLLAVSQEWEEIDLTAYRLKRRADGTYQITVTSYQPQGS
jgi:hypothetical protein